MSILENNSHINIYIDETYNTAFTPIINPLFLIYLFIKTTLIYMTKIGKLVQIIVHDFASKIDHKMRDF